MASAKRAESPVTGGVTTLKRRAEYLRVRKGARWATGTFVLEAKSREEALQVPEQRPRFGFTVTRQVGKAVERNRIRRRLKAAIGNLSADHARSEFDYVIIARRPALTSTFEAIVADLVKAFDRVHRAPAKAR